jgi:protein-L-isoaspartate(D-aspartate) O-methyltransferase
VELADRARARLERLGYRVEVRAGDGTRGWPERAPFQGIVVSAGAPDLPIPLLQQLDEGGRLLIPVGSIEEQELLRVTRAQGRMIREHLCRCRFVKLIGEHGWPNPP